MTDAHTHVVNSEIRCFLSAPTSDNPKENDYVFYGWHPFDFLQSERALLPDEISDLKNKIISTPRAGIGEIGLDRLKTKNIPDNMRSAFKAQLILAADLHKPVSLHGAKCWGEVVKACNPFKGIIPAFLFHSFSRSGGLLPEIESLNGFISVGPAILNDHAVNYRELVKSIPEHIILVESDATPETISSLPSIYDIARKIAEIRKTTFEKLSATIEENANRFAAAF
jgi:TatD DNase family protein